MPVQMGAVFTMPDAFINSDEGHRIHKRVCKKSADGVLSWWHEFVLMKHFRGTNRQMYAHKNRQKDYVLYKIRVFQTNVDLMKSGKSKDQMMARKPRTVYARDNPKGTMMSYMTYQWSFPATVSSTSSGVSPQDMNAELTAWTDEEIKQGAGVYAQFFAKHYMKELARRPRLQKRAGDIQAKVFK